ncbi:hypothetical protein FHX41_4982 [Actinomadura hallensis]|uniref:Uncharacterized protein n=1 Tax=Actinomadura hallensis TaxID=337895 RepID=A0A543IKW5_9ACTN|nr:hypothetical protein FHX41_4982 [Actinomadura hallensis]
MNPRHAFIPPHPSQRVCVPPYGMMAMAWAHDFPDS